MDDRNHEENISGRYGGYYYYSVVFAPNIDLLDEIEVLDDVLVLNMMQNKQRVLSMVTLDASRKAQQFASEDKPRALRSLTGIVNVGSLPNDTDIPSFEVATVLFEDKLLSFDRY